MGAFFPAWPLGLGIRPVLSYCRIAVFRYPVTGIHAIAILYPQLNRALLLC